ncbi:MAG: DNA primase [Patescibacteria group bacterium]|nr:DNA primase [Patescibacteria group bacterium]
MLNSPADEIKSKLDIAEIIGGYIKLRKAGANYKAVCPFHSEKTPSLFVSPSRQIWHCFGCGAGHSIFDFVMKVEGVEFGDALRMLAQKAGVDLKPIRPELKTERRRLYEVCELATKFFEKQLQNSSKGKKAKSYLLERGIGEESIKKWRLGWAPDTWQGLSDFLNQKGYKKEEIEKVGLSIKNDQGGHYDRFRGRVMFPVFDFNSQVVGFGGRSLKKDKEIAKYINIPNTLLYDKSRILYGLDKSKIEIRKKDLCILVEGYADVIMAHQSEMGNVVATSGTALTPYQLSILKRYSDNLFLAFDMDIAGDAATKRGIDLAQSKGFNIKIVSLPEDKDPADVIHQKPEQFGKMVEESISILDFYFQNAFSQFDEETAEGKKEISKILLPVIHRIPNRIEQSSWVQQLARKLNVREKVVEEELRKIKPEKSFDEGVSVLTPQSPPILKKTRKDLLEERLITLVLKAPQHLGVFNKETISLFSSRTQEVLNDFDKRENLSQELVDFISYLSLKADVEEIEEEEILPEIESCLKEVQSLEIKSKLDIISLDIKRAEEEKDLEKIKELTQKFNSLTKKVITS